MVVKTATMDDKTASMDDKTASMFGRIEKLKNWKLNDNENENNNQD